MELGALRPGTFDPNVAAVLLNYPVANAEAKAGAPANFLGGKKQLEDLAQDFRWHSRPVVLDGNLDSIVQLTSPNVDISGTTRFVDRLLRVR